MKTMKRAALLLAAAAAALLLTVMPAMAEQEQGQEAAKAVEATQEKTAAVVTEATQEETSTWAEQALAFAGDHFSDVCVVAYLVYYIWPRRGARAALLREKKALDQKLGAYFDDAGNRRSVANILSAGNESISKFMSDVAPDVRRIGELLPVAEELVRQLRETDARQEKTLDAMRACREAVLLMGKQMETLMLAAGGAGDEKRAAIYAAYAAETKKLNERMAALTAEAPHDAEETGAAV